MQDKTAVLGNTPGVEEDERYIEKAYRTLSEDNRKKLEVYAAALRRTQLAHEGADRNGSFIHWPFGFADGHLL